MEIIYFKLEYIYMQTEGNVFGHVTKC